MLDEMEDGIQHDDGFDSEATTLTPVSSRNEYYNSLEHIWLKQKLTPENFAKPKSTRGNSESMGSLDTNGSDHDYYNEFHPSVMSDHVFREGNETVTSAVWMWKYIVICNIALKNGLHCCLLGLHRISALANSKFGHFSQIRPEIW